MEETLVRLVDETEEGKYLLSIRGLNYIAVVGAALNRLLRLAFALVKNQTYYQISKSELTPVAV